MRPCTHITPTSAPPLTTRRRLRSLRSPHCVHERSLHYLSSTMTACNSLLQLPFWRASRSNTFFGHVSRACDGAGRGRCCCPRRERRACTQRKAHTPDRRRGHASLKRVCTFPPLPLPASPPSPLALTARRTARDTRDCQSCAGTPPCRAQTACTRGCRALLSVCGSAPDRDEVGRKKQRGSRPGHPHGMQGRGRMDGGEGQGLRWCYQVQSARRPPTARAATAAAHRSRPRHRPRPPAPRCRPAAVLASHPRRRITRRARQSPGTWTPRWARPRRRRRCPCCPRGRTPPCPPQTRSARPQCPRAARTR